MAFYQEIHSCTIPKGKEHLLGNHVCNRRPNKLNTVDCGWDAGDCKKSEQFPDCQVDWIGNGWCDGGEYNTKECGWDGGDCDLFNNLTNCNVDNPDGIGDGLCEDYIDDDVYTDYYSRFDTHMIIVSYMLRSDQLVLGHECISAIDVAVGSCWDIV